MIGKKPERLVSKRTGRDITRLGDDCMDCLIPMGPPKWKIWVERDENGRAVPHVEKLPSLDAPGVSNPP